MTDPDGAAGRIAGVVTAAVERVFACVADLHDAALAALSGGEQAARTGATRLEERARELLAAPGQLAVGLGLVAAPRPDRDVRLLWWQADPAGGRITALRPDLRPASLDFYDYPATDWFDVPRRTGRRHVVGPYVDVHGTGRYLLTLTGPLVDGGEFLGVIGADVPVNRFEGSLLRALDPGADAVVVLDEEGRVVLSTSGRWLVGDLLAAPPSASAPSAEVAGAPWRVHLLGGDVGSRAGGLLPA
jgi:Cache domain